MTVQKQAALQLQLNREELAHLARVAVMGEMAVSLAHELTQPLTAIMSNADVGERLLRRQPTDLDEFRNILADIKRDVRRAGDVIHGIRRMAKKGKTVRESLDLNDIVRRVLRMVNPEALFRSCGLRAELEPDLPAVDGDPVELHQVLINLIVNSIEAMRHTPVTSRKIIVTTRKRGASEAEVSVHDRGPGITQEKRDRLFERFFSTKAEGLGMGLAITRTIIQSHGGMIDAENLPEGGARFYFTLPVRFTASRADATESCS